MKKLYYYSSPNVSSFKSMMDLSDEDIVVFMNENIPGHAIFHKNPKGYIHQRKETEAWLFEGFKSMGGRPKTKHPIYMTLGSSSYISQIGPYVDCRVFPLELFDETTVSFTYPDSYVSRWLFQEKNEYYNPKFHGRIFRVSELDELLRDSTVSNDAWKIEERKFDYFIEAQIWDTDRLKENN